MLRQQINNNNNNNNNNKLNSNVSNDTLRVLSVLVAHSFSVINRNLSSKIYGLITVSHTNSYTIYIS